MRGNDAVRILVTGGSGFIGRHVIQELSGAHEVLAPSHRDLDLADADAVQAWFGRHPVDAVVHAAVKPGHRNAPDQSAIAEMNLRQFFSLVRCRGEFGRFVVLTSGAVYGVQGPIVRATEDRLGYVVPADDHGFAKYVESLWLSRDDNAVELRPFGVYGPGEDYAIRFISNACAKAVLGLPVTLRRDRRFSYVWVEDLAKVVARALTGGPRTFPPGAYNVSPGEPVSLLRLAGSIAAMVQPAVPVRVGDPTAGIEYSGDAGRLESHLGDFRWVAPGEGVERLLAWYASRADTLDRSLLEVDR